MGDEKGTGEDREENGHGNGDGKGEVKEKNRKITGEREGRWWTGYMGTGGRVCWRDDVPQ